MADVRPFKGYRPAPELVEKIASPPYDVLSSEEAREMAAANPLSFLHVVKAEIDLDPDVDVHSDVVYEKSRDNLRALIDGGKMIRDPEPCFYVYQQKMGDHVQAGVVAGASVDEYQEGLIKKHEFTRPDKENDRARHVEVLGANAGPVFLTYKAEKAVDEVVNRIRKETPVYDFTAADGVGHTLWVVGRKDDVEALSTAFEKVPALYVADGHHRSAAASRVREIMKEKNPSHTGEEQYNYFLTVTFPHDQMYIMDYNRVVKDLNGLSADELLERIAGKFEVSETDEPKPTEKKTYGMYLGGKWYRLKAKEGTYPADDPVKSLDISVLSANLLDPVLGIKDPRTDTRIDFVGGIRGMKELEKRCSQGWEVAFAVPAVTVEELMAIADAGEVMPPKSTWFEPKLRSGVVVKMLEE